MPEGFKSDISLKNRLSDMEHKGWDLPIYTGILLLEDGTIFRGFGFGFEGISVGELCFNTSMTGYQEILTDPSYTDQIIVFTFPHIGNVGTNGEDIETVDMVVQTGIRGCVVSCVPTSPSNYRSEESFESWLQHRKMIGISGIDTRALTLSLREKGFMNAVIGYHRDGDFALDRLHDVLRDWDGITGTDLTDCASCDSSYGWHQSRWDWEHGYDNGSIDDEGDFFHIVAIDYGLKRNILRHLRGLGCRVTVLPSRSGFTDIMSHCPDGIFLSNGPGDPSATGTHAVGVIRALLETDIPIFGICLGHQLLALSLGAATIKMGHGHHGANHPVKEMATGKVEITSMNHGFAVDKETLPPNVIETHISLFDGSNCGLSVKNKPVFSVQYHPEASPGPHDTHILFKRFMDMVSSQKVSAKKRSSA